MSYDLHAGLGALGDAERATPAELPVPALQARARRRRTVRLASASGAALLTVGAVAVAAVALPGFGTVAPASPTSSWTPDADGWPPAVTLDGPNPRCGEAMPNLIEPQEEPLVVIEPVTLTGPLVAGGVVEVSSTLTAPGDFPFHATAPRLLVVRDGVVFGTRDYDVNGGSNGWSPGGRMGNSLESSSQLWLARCDDGGGSTPLDAGTYDLYVTQDLVAGGSASERPGPVHTVAAGPFPVVVEAAPDAPAP